MRLLPVRENNAVLCSAITIDLFDVPAERLDRIDNLALPLIAQLIQGVEQNQEGW